MIAYSMALVTELQNLGLIIILVTAAKEPRNIQLLMAPVNIIVNDEKG